MTKLYQLPVKSLDNFFTIVGAGFVVSSAERSWPPALILGNRKGCPYKFIIRSEYMELVDHSFLLNLIDERQDILVFSRSAKNLILNYMIARTFLPSIAIRV